LQPVAAKVEVIVTDHVMPASMVLFSFGNCNELRPQVPVIVMSGLAEAEAQYAGLDVTFLRKPCPPESLIQAVRARRLKTFCKFRLTVPGPDHDFAAGANPRLVLLVLVHPDRA